MSDFAEEFHAKLAFFKERFPQSEYDIAISVFHSLYHGVSYLHTIEQAMEGFGFGDGEVQGCSFPFTEEYEDYHGVKFSRDLTWGDENSTDYWENIVPFDVFLDMLRASIEWHLRKFPEDETSLLHYLHEHNLALHLDGSDFPNQDHAETWWNKCNEKRLLHRSLRGLAQTAAENLVWGIDDIFVYLPEHRMLDFLTHATQRQNYTTFFGRRLEDLLTLNTSYARGALLDFSIADEVRLVDVEYYKFQQLKHANNISVSIETFDTLLQAVASAYTERRPQHALEVSELMRNRIK